MVIELLAVVLSVGAIDALIPLMIIVILIVAAAGATRGYSIFNLFGIATLAGIGVGRGSIQARSALNRYFYQNVRAKQNLGVSLGSKAAERIKTKIADRRSTKAKIKAAMGEGASGTVAISKNPIKRVSNRIKWAVSESTLASKLRRGNRKQRADRKKEKAAEKKQKREDAGKDSKKKNFIRRRLRDVRGLGKETRGGFKKLGRFAMFAIAPPVAIALLARHVMTKGKQATNKEISGRTIDGKINDAKKKLDMHELFAAIRREGTFEGGKAAHAKQKAQREYDTIDDKESPRARELKEKIDKHQATIDYYRANPGKGTTQIPRDILPAGAGARTHDLTQGHRGTDAAVANAKAHLENLEKLNKRMDAAAAKYAEGSRIGGAEGKKMMGEARKELKDANKEFHNTKKGSGKLLKVWDQQSVKNSPTAVVATSIWTIFARRDEEGHRKLMSMGNDSAGSTHRKGKAEDRDFDRSDEGQSQAEADRRKGKEDGEEEG